MKQELALSVILLFTPVACSGQPDDSLPPGYKWGDCHNITASLPTPEGWYIKEENRGNTNACFITREEITSESSFQTGLSINTIPHTAAKMGRKPTEVAREYARKANGGKDQGVKEKTQEDFKSFRSIASIYEFPQFGKSISIQTTAIANDRADLTYIITFESPENEWDWAKQIGEIMVDRARLNPSFTGSN